jgi:hypothetical protein
MFFDWHHIIAMLSATALPFGPFISVNLRIFGLPATVAAVSTTSQRIFTSPTFVLPSGDRARALYYYLLIKSYKTMNIPV